MGLRALAVAAWLGMSALCAGPAFAQRHGGDKAGGDKAGDKDTEDDDATPEPSGGIPSDMEHFEVIDLTYTMRDDTYNTITLDNKDANVGYVGTHQGRVYKTTDAGRTWEESTVIPEQRPLWAAPGTSIFLGGIRDAGPGVTTFGGPNGKNLDFGHLPGQMVPIHNDPIPSDAFAGESAAMAGGGVASLGVGLSQRAPRLQLLVGIKGRPAPSTNRSRFLFDRVLRGTAITSIAVDPDNPRLLFAATVNGLYKSDNGGDSWVRTFSGVTAAERIALRIAIRQGEPKLAILGTVDGAFMSYDKGESWQKNGSVGGAISEIAYDTTDPKFVYLATSGGVVRSNDGGHSFDSIYYSSLPAENDVHSLALDPFDHDTLYIGTSRGAYVTHKARTARGPDDWVGLEGVQSVEAVPVIAACGKHKGHLYAAVTVYLPSLNYGADPPESAVIESWDGGKTWRQLFTGQTDGNVQWFWMDQKDPDQLWIAWTTGVHRLVRLGNENRKSETGEVERPDGPPMSELILATLHHHGLDLDTFADKISLGFVGDIIPKKVGVTGVYRHAELGGVRDDPQFASNRYLQIASGTAWEVWAFASWDLPERIYSPGSVPMMRQRINHMNDELRHQLMNTVRRAYSELLRIQAVVSSPTELDLKTKVFYRLRMEQLEAIIDLASGDYLSRWYKKFRRKTR